MDRLYVAQTGAQVPRKHRIHFHKLSYVFSSSPRNCTTGGCEPHAPTAGPTNARRCSRMQAGAPHAMRSVKPEPCDRAPLGALDPESHVHSPPPARGESDPACVEAACVMPGLAASSSASRPAPVTVPDAASEPLAAATSWLESLKEGCLMPEHYIALILTRERALPSPTLLSRHRSAGLTPQP